MIETGRLRLRRFREDDRETVARWNADPVFAEHLGGVHTRARSDEVFDRWQRHWDEHGFGSLGIEWANTGELIGRTGPAFHSVWRLRSGGRLGGRPGVVGARDRDGGRRGVDRVGVRRSRLRACGLDRDRGEHRVSSGDGEARSFGCSSGCRASGASCGCTSCTAMRRPATESRRSRRHSCQMRAGSIH